MTSAVADFLAQKRIAVVGVSRSADQTANFIFRKLRDAGYDVFPVNPNTTTAEAVACHPSLASIPGGVDAVVVVTHPSVAEAVVRDCVALGITRVWLHRSFGQGSVSDEAVRIAREHGIRVIPGACPLMFREPVDFGHKCMRFVLKLTGGLPGESRR